MKIDPLDKLFSEYIRRRAIQRCGGCERCGTIKPDLTREDGSTFPGWMSLQCSHFHGRTKKSVRFDPDNAAGLCAGCHMYLEHNPLAHYEWFKEYLIETAGAQAFEYLNIRAQTPQKVDKEAINVYIKQLLKEME